MNWGTGLFGACLVVAPESKLLIFTSAVSTICHLLLLGSLAILQHNVLSTFFPEVTLVNQAPDDMRSVILAVSLVVSFVCSILLQLMSCERRRQKFGLRMRIGSLSWPDRDAFLWACERNYHDLLHMCTDEQCKKRDYRHLNGLHLACRKGEQTCYLS